MTDELNLDDIEKDITNKNAVEDRIRNLHASKKEAELKLETESKARTEAESKLAQMEKDTSFLNSFSDVTAKFPTASEYKDKIREKVNMGYSVDDATVSILVAEGKYTPPAPQRENIAGGSAANQITNQPVKKLNELTSTERWDMLKEAEKRGDIGLN